MDFGILGSFDNAMADLSAEELEQANIVSPVAAPEPVTEATPVPASPFSAGTEESSALSPAAAPPIDDRARALALRLVGGGAQVSTNDTTRLTVQVVGHPVITVDPASPGPVLIGRGAADATPLDTNHLAIDLAVASREHCRISLVDDRPAIVDLGSTNGTTIHRDGDTIPVGSQPVELCRGDVITTAGGAAVIATIGTVGL